MGTQVITRDTGRRLGLVGEVVVDIDRREVVALGPYIETKIDPDCLTIQLFKNGQLCQNSSTAQMIFTCSELVSFISTNMTLLPGDVILTGTPSAIEIKRTLCSENNLSNF